MAVLFEDRFTEPDGPAANWIPVMGEWAVENEEYVQRSTAERAISQAGDVGWTNYVMEAKVTLKSAAVYGGAGIEFRVIGGDTYYRFFLEFPQQLLMLHKRLAGSFTLLGAQPFNVALNRTYRLKVSVEGTKIKCYVDGVLQIYVDVVDEETLYGMIGLETLRTFASFDDVVVTEIVAAKAVCFIATATYGSVLSPELKVLRQFRDTFMLRNRVGACLVQLYYRLSPPLAQLIKDRRKLRLACQTILKPVIKGLKRDARR